MVIVEPILVINSCVIKDQLSIDQDLAEAPREVEAFVGRALSHAANTVRTALKCKLHRETIEPRCLMLSMVLRNPGRLATPDRHDSRTRAGCRPPSTTTRCRKAPTDSTRTKCSEESELVRSIRIRRRHTGGRTTPSSRGTWPWPSTSTTRRRARTA